MDISSLRASWKHGMDGRGGFIDQTTQRSRPRVLDKKSLEDSFAFVLVGTCAVQRLLLISDRSDR